MFGPPTPNSETSYESPSRVQIWHAPCSGFGCSAPAHSRPTRSSVMRKHTSIEDRGVTLILALGVAVYGVMFAIQVL